MANFTDFSEATTIASGDYLEGHLASEASGSERKFTALAVGQGAFTHAGQYAELNNQSNGTALTITAASTDFSNKVQIPFSTASSVEQGLNADNATEDITVGTTGIYHVSVSLSFSGGANETYSFAVFANNGANQLTTRSTRRVGSGGAVGNAGICGNVSVAAGVTLEVWIQNETSTDNCTVEDASFSAFRIG